MANGNDTAAVTATPAGDWFGIAASLGCAVHCIATPFLIGYLPAAGAAFLTDHWFHVVAAVLCGLIGAVTFLPGWRRHGKFTPGFVGAIGLTMITAATFAAPDCCTSGVCEHAETVRSAAVSPGIAHIFGGLMLATGHLLNHRHRCRCRCHHG